MDEATLLHDLLIFAPIQRTISICLVLFTDIFGIFFAIWIWMDHIDQQHIYNGKNWPHT